MVATIRDTLRPATLDNVQKLCFRPFSAGTHGQHIQVENFADVVLSHFLVSRFPATVTAHRRALPDGNFSGCNRTVIIPIVNYATREVKITTLSNGSEEITSHIRAATRLPVRASASLLDRRCAVENRTLDLRVDLKDFLKESAVASANLHNGKETPESMGKNNCARQHPNLFDACHASSKEVATSAL